MTRWMHAKETKNRTYMQWSAEPAETSMERKDQQQATRLWTTRRDEKKRRMGLVSSWMSGRCCRERSRVVPEDIWADRWDARNVEHGRMGAKFWCTVGAQ